MRDDNDGCVIRWVRSTPAFDVKNEQKTERDKKGYQVSEVLESLTAHERGGVRQISLSSMPQTHNKRLTHPTLTRSVFKIRIWTFKRDRSLSPPFSRIRFQVQSRCWYSMAEGKMPKQKTHKGIKKRFRVTASGKAVHRHSGTSHLAYRLTKKQRRNLRGTTVVAKSETARIVNALIPSK